MKPNDFTLNSDYLSIAQVSSNTYDVYVGGGTLQPGGYTEQNFDFTIKNEIGAIDRVLISKDGGSYRLGKQMSLFPTWTGTEKVAGWLMVYRTSGSNLRAQLVLENYSEDMSITASYPSMTFKIKVSSFKPPNVF